MVVDSSALVAIFTAEPGWEALADVLVEHPGALISVVTVVETASVLCGRRFQAARGDVDLLVNQLGIFVQPVSLDQLDHALHALLTYGKGRHAAGLNLGDCFAYALAKSRGDALLFKGDDFARTDIVPAWRPGARR